MKRLLLLTLLFALPYTAAPAAAQPAQQTHSAAAGPHTGGLLVWKWANFAILVGVLGWLIRKHAGPYYAARSKKIEQDRLEAADFHQRAEAQAAQVELRLRDLEADIARLRAESAAETRAESERRVRQTAEEIAKIEAGSEEQIVAAGRAARMELKRYSVELAIGIARKKIAGRLTPETQDALVRGFVRHLETPASARTS